MIPYTVSARRGNLVAGQNELSYMPEGGARGRRLTVLLHGQSQGDLYPITLGWNDPFGAEGVAAPQQAAVAANLAAAGVPCAAIYGDGPAWGSDLANADMEAARGNAGKYGCATDKLVIVAVSMGVLDGLNYMRAYPARVAGMIGIAPASDIDDIRDNNRGGNTRPLINQAWSPYVTGGLVSSDTSSTKALPTRANPSNTANATAIGTSGPIRFYYSTADTVVLPATVTTLASRIGATCTTTIVSTTLDHSDAEFGAAPAAEVAAFCSYHSDPAT